VISFGFLELTVIFPPLERSCEVYRDSLRRIFAFWLFEGTTTSLVLWDGIDFTDAQFAEPEKGL
jgi:hypothetical protein